MAQGMKRLAKETAVYGVSSIVGRFLNWMLVPMYTRVLDTTADFGVVTNIYGWIALLLVFLTYGMETGFFRFINRKEEVEPARVYATALVSLAGSSVAFIALLWALHGSVSGALGYAHHPEYILMMGVTVAVDAFCTIPFAYLRYQGRAIRFAGLKMLSIFLNIGLNLFFLLACPWLLRHAPDTVNWFYRPDYSVGYIFISNVLTTALTLVLLLPDMLPGWRAKPSGLIWRQMLRYSLPILVLGVAGIFNQTADKILFPFLFDDKGYANEQLGIYGACFKIALIMVMFTQAFRYAYEPFIFARNKEEGGTRAYVEAMKYFIIFTLAIFLFVSYYIDLLKYFVDARYYPGLRVVPIVMLGELFFGIYFNLSFWYKLTDRTEWGAYFSLIGCVATVSIILFFGPTYGYMACAWASLGCNLLMMVLSYVVGQRMYPIPYNLRSAGIYTGLAVVLYLAGTLPQIDSEGLRLAYRTVLLLLFVVFTVKRDLPLKELPYIGRYF